MPTQRNASPNYEELTAYLASIGIDANRVRSEFDEDGYDYMAANGPMTTTGRAESVRMPWPTPEVFENVKTLFNGGTLISPEIEKVLDKQKADEEKLTQTLGEAAAKASPKRTPKPKQVAPKEDSDG